MVTCWTFVGLVLALGALGNSLKMFEIEMASKAQSPEAKSPSERIALPLRPFRGNPVSGHDTAMHVGIAADADTIIEATSMQSRSGEFNSNSANSLVS